MGISSTLYSGYSKQEIQTASQHPLELPQYPFLDSQFHSTTRPNSTSLKMASLHKFIESELIP